VTEERHHTRVGAIALVLLGAAVAMTLTLQGRHVRSGFTVHVELSRIGALVEGAEVRVAGRDIGIVERVRFLPLQRRSEPAPPGAHGEARARIVLDVWIDARYRRWVRTGSDWFQNQPSVLGEAYLEAGPPAGGGDPGEPIAEDATVRGIDPPRIDDLMQKSYENLGQVTALLRDGLPEARALGRALDDLGRELEQVLDPTAMGTLSAGRRRLWSEGLLAWRAAAATGTTPDQVMRTYHSVGNLLARARARLGDLRARFVVVQREIDRLRSELGTEQLARIETLAARGERLVRGVDDVLAQAQAIIAMVARAEGTVGAFLADTELADEFKAMSKVIKQTPWETIGHPQRKARP
jgi:phospholipid/cholesterol/gamma-HCH transport system substrate-binding protein